MAEHEPYSTKLFDCGEDVETCLLVGERERRDGQRRKEQVATMRASPLLSFHCFPFINESF